MENILVAVDFSDASRKAIVYAAELAKSFDAKIFLVHAYFAPFPVGDAPGYIPLSLPEIQQDNEALLETEIEYMADQYKVNATGRVKMGSVSSVINEIGAEIHAGLVVMGMKGAGNTSSVFGSAVTAYIRKAKLPTLIIPDAVQFNPIEHITFAADFEGKTDPERFGILEEIAAKFNSTIRVVHVQKTAEEMNAGEVAGKLKADKDISRIAHSFHTIVNEDVEKGVIAFIDEHPTDMLVMVAHHHNIFERLFGSIHTRLIAYRSTVPLLVLHD